MKKNLVIANLSVEMALGYCAQGVWKYNDSF